MNQLYDIIPTNPKVFQVEIEGRILYQLLKKTWSKSFLLILSNKREGI
ncbi:MAG: hypothetical protein ACQEW2_20410 [Bacillota bacterium]|nr:hypothetical protein [Cytobacillus firmus]MEC1895241.1 hypothetical protein [Cytobacillus firmus]MED4451925.1 hypothetical protein [Cytobacillus firmus]MED4768156.1 hypothetical protein [Cytobacillus firmus]